MKVQMELSGLFHDRCKVLQRSTVGHKAGSKWLWVTESQLTYLQCNPISKAQGNHARVVRKILRWRGTERLNLDMRGKLHSQKSQQYGCPSKSKTCIMTPVDMSMHMGEAVHNSTHR